MPLFESVTVSVADWPCFKIAVAFPVQEFFAAVALATGFAQILKLWNATPMFVTLNVTVPAGTIELFDSLKASSEGLPRVTVMAVTFWVAAGFTAAGRLDRGRCGSRTESARATPRQHRRRERAP